ncbi:FimB/Mfa2 family fimbrial subunit [Parabacteroides faecis]|uniref:FimB/Mfa2 family fimbrial subunit n=1 Tax=Parabacteroides faecis TaxID=1217282 RepID=UPI003522DBDE
MKKKELCAVACLFWLAGCNDPASDEVEIVKNLFPVQFSVQLQKEVLPFPSTRSMPSNAFPEPIVPDKENPDKELKDFCSTIEYLVYDKNDLEEPVKHHIYNVETDNDFSIVYDTLPAGNYQVYFLAHQSKKSLFVKNTFSFDKLSDTFYGTKVFNVEKTEETNMDIDLERIVSRIEFKAIDPVPDVIKQFDISVKNYPAKLNILTKEGLASSEEQSFTYLFKSEDKGQTGKTHSFYTFVASGSKRISATLTSTDIDGQVMRCRTVTDILPIANKVIRYTGILYTPPKPDDSENTFNLIIGNNGEWSESVENELPE